MLFYVLNFNNHTFVTCNSYSEVIEATENMEVNDVETDIEIICCYSENIELSLSEFKKEFKSLSEFKKED